MGVFYAVHVLCMECRALDARWFWPLVCYVHPCFIHRPTLQDVVDKALHRLHTPAHLIKEGVRPESLAGPRLSNLPRGAGSAAVLLGLRGPSAG